MVDVERIKELARIKGLSIAQLEVQAGIANGTIGGWKESRPFVDTLSKVAKVLECQIEDLLIKQEGV